LHDRAQPHHQLNLQTHELANGALNTHDGVVGMFCSLEQMMSTSNKSSPDPGGFTAPEEEVMP
jgi:hypothetical protein